MDTANQIDNNALTDEEIISRILAGEHYWYERLMRKYNTLLYRIAMSIINDDMEAEDIMQTAYINAFLNLPNFKNKSTFSTWLTRILINESLLHKKRRIKGLQIRAEQTINESHNETPLKTFMNKELKLILEKAVASLP